MANSHSKYNPEYHRQWHLKNRARRLLAAKANYLANRERKLRKNAEYRKLHPEMAEKAAIKYRASHRQECRQRCRDWYQRNKEAQQLRSRIKNAKAFAEHREKILAQNRKWAANNKQKIAARDARRRALIKGATLGNIDPIKDWMKEVRMLPFVRCYWCGTKVRGKKAHFDHVVALANGGIHCISNLCTSCPECNCSKQAKEVSEWVRNGQTFLNV